MTNLDWAMVVIACLAAAFWLIVIWQWWHKPTAAINEPSSDWSLTGHINFKAESRVMDAEDIEGLFVVQVEEKREVKDVGGGVYNELRWRNPNRREVREIVRCYHAYKAQPLNELIKKEPNEETARRLGPIAPWDGGVTIQAR